MLYRFGHLLFSIYFKLFFRWQVYGRENIPEKGPFIVCSNHINWIDPVFIACSFPSRIKIHFMAKEELFQKNFLVTFVLTRLGAFPVKRDTADISAIKKFLQLLKEGQVLGLFPEGTRSKTGKLLKPMNGAALIALRSGVPIVPVAILDPYRPWKKLRITIGEPFRLAVQPGQEKKTLKKEILDKMSSNIMESIKLLFPPGDRNAVI